MWAWAWRFRTLKFGQNLFKTPRGYPVVSRRFAGSRIYLDISRSDTHRLLFLEGERFVKERQLLKHLIWPGMSVVDVGANIGYYLLLFRRFIREDGSVLCIEPEPRNLEELRRNIACNTLKNVKVISAAAGASDGKINLTPGLNAVVHESSKNADIKIDLCKLDSVVTCQIDFLKIDVEGYEVQVLMGAIETIRRCKPIIFMEVHPWMLSGDMGVSFIINVLREHYDDLRYFELVPNSSAGLFAKIGARYLWRSSIQTIRSEQHLINECLNGRRETFWLIARA